MTTKLPEHIAITRFNDYKARLKDLKPLDQVRHQTSTLTEELPYIGLVAYKLEKQNHGSPQCPEIKINENTASATIPQAWSKVIDGTTYWFYNFPWAKAEAKYLGKRIPTDDEWIKMLESVNGNSEEKARELNIPLVGLRDGHYNEFVEGGDFVHMWSSTAFDAGHIRYALLKRSNPKMLIKDTNDNRHGMPIRFFFG